MYERAQKNPKIDWLLNKTINEVKAGENGKVTSVLLEDTQSGEVQDHATDGVFIAIGHQPNSKLFTDKLDLDDEGYILVHEGTRTSVDGVFAAGDITDRVYRQAVTAAGMGCMAAIDCERWLEARESH